MIIFYPSDNKNGTAASDVAIQQSLEKHHIENLTLNQTLYYKVRPGRLSYQHNFKRKEGYEVILQEGEDIKAGAHIAVELANFFHRDVTYTCGDNHRVIAEKHSSIDAVKHGEEAVNQYVTKLLTPNP